MSTSPHRPPRYHKLTLTLLKASWRRAQRLVTQRRTQIIRVAEEMLVAENESISGERLVALVESVPLDPVPQVGVAREVVAMQVAGLFLFGEPGPLVSSSSSPYTAS